MRYAQRGDKHRSGCYSDQSQRVENIEPTTNTFPSHHMQPRKGGGFEFWKSGEPYNVPSVNCPQ